jgi:ATP-dependent DNA helicase PIF1
LRKVEGHQKLLYPSSFLNQYDFKVTVSLLSDLLKSLAKDLNEEQTVGLDLLSGTDNVFLTGGAGTGKSHLLKTYLRGVDKDAMPILASTGAAAVLVGGRTFHSFFGLGILEGGAEATIERATKDRRVIRRLKKAGAIIIDEISMISGQTLAVAEQIARNARNSSSPWGGLRVVAVGDFAQLPPITRGSSKRDWAFLSPTWSISEFKNIHLKTIMRARNDSEFCLALHDARRGELSARLENILEWRQIHPSDEDEDATRLYARKVDVEKINQDRLEKIGSTSVFFKTAYHGDERYLKTLRTQAPIPEVIEVKKGAFVMLRQNDPKGRWVNGSLGHVEYVDDDGLEIKLLKGNTVEVEPVSFSMLDADGNEVASAKNYPVSLAYAITIHKAQGATLDKIVASLAGLWEPGQAYVALSRVTASTGLFIDAWDKRSFFADPAVLKSGLVE